MRRELGFGSLDAGDNWTAEYRVTLVEKPDPGVAMRLLASKPADQMPPNVVVERTSSSAGTIDKRVRELQRTLSQSVPQTKTLRDGPFAFDDGVTGRCFAVRLPIQGMQVQQVHVFRQDAEWVFQLSATFLAEHSRKLETLEALIRSFRPAPEE